MARRRLAGLVEPRHSLSAAKNRKKQTTSARVGYETCNNPIGRRSAMGTKQETAMRVRARIETAARRMKTMLCIFWATVAAAIVWWQHDRSASMRDG